MPTIGCYSLAKRAASKGRNSQTGQYASPYTHNKADWGSFSFEQDHGHLALHEALTEGEDNACDI